MIVALGGIAFGMYKYQKDKVEKQGKDILTTIAIVTSNLKSRKIFVAVFITYGIFFSLVSGTLVYQPEINFVTHYGATIPSGFIAPCCDGPGYMPKIIVYHYRARRTANNSNKFCAANYRIILSCNKCINCN